MGILLAAMLILIPPTEDRHIVTEIEGNVITLEDGTETANWFLIDGNEVVM